MEGKILKSDVREIINRPSGQFTAFDAKRLVRAMKELGWKDEKKLRFGGDPQHCWYRGNSSLAKGMANHRYQDQLCQQQARIWRMASDYNLQGPKAIRNQAVDLVTL